MVSPAGVRKKMVGNSPQWKIIFYFVLFCASFLVFDSISVIIGIFFALLAFYYFSTKSSKRDLS